MFIDGLDEINGDYHSVLALIRNLVDQENVKICLSSRPLLVFEEAFSVAPSLKLQDLTYHTIRAYADTQLSDLIQQRVDERDGHRVKYLVDNIVDRANGVFLWAVIAIRDVRDGLRDIVDLDELTRTIDSLPSQLESLFMLMLKRIKPACQRDAARFLQIALYFPSPVESSTLTLCILYFIHCQRSSEDAPLVYDQVATSKIVETCKTLRTRLLSHTAGLLDLTSSNDGACRLHDTDEPLLHTRITFLHRTARDFIHENDHAKSFLASKGFTKAEVHILVARGLLSHLAQFSEQIPSRVPRYELPYSYSYLDFLALLHHIAEAEKLIGAAQHGLMQSLDYDLNFRKPLEAGDQVFGTSFEEPFMVDPHTSRVDVVGMAAAVGMTIYICDRLNLPHASRRNGRAKPYLGQIGFDRSYPATMLWSKPNSVEDSSKTSALLRQASDYCQTLRQFLQVDSDAASLQKSQQWASDAFAESYLLACCDENCQDLVPTLLQAGANPMVKVTCHPGAEILRLHDEPPICFWQQWLRFLGPLRNRYRKVNHRSGGFLLSDYHRSSGLTERYVLDTTKSLLAGGVDANQSTGGADSRFDQGYLKRIGLKTKGFDLVLEATAMFTLEECFSKEPDFCEIADAISSSIQRPTRWLLKIEDLRECTVFENDPPSLPLNVEDCRALWPLIENWESSGRAQDLQALQSTVERMWRDNNPETDFSEEVDDDARPQRIDEL